MRIALIAIGMALFAVSGFFLYQSGFLTPAEDPAIVAPEAGPDAQTGVTEQQGIIPPSFDIVRVDPTGEAVVAGRSAPGAEVILYANGKEIARETANKNGEWVMVVMTPLSEGDQELTLEMSLPDGETVRSEQVVVVGVPERSGVKPLVVLGQEGAASRVLQQPGDGIIEGDLSLDIVDYDQDGAVILQGRALPGSIVRAYVNNRPVGETRANEEGLWRLSPNQSIVAGVYQLRIDQLDGAGKVSARVELPFERASPEAAQLAAGQVIVQPGNSLWRIARQLYGRGVQYTVIYQANKEQIRGPDLIYPGQVFDVPNDD